MTEHLPECPILKPCCDDEEWPEHGFCGNAIGGRCLHCMAECICDALRACEQRMIAAAREAVVGLPEYALRDTCASAIDALKEQS